MTQLGQQLPRFFAHCEAGVELLGHLIQVAGHANELPLFILFFYCAGRARQRLVASVKSLVRKLNELLPNAVHTL